MGGTQNVKVSNMQQCQLNERVLYAVIYQSRKIDLSASELALVMHTPAPTPHSQYPT